MDKLEALVLQALAEWPAVTGMSAHDVQIVCQASIHTEAEAQEILDDLLRLSYISGIHRYSCTDAGRRYVHLIKKAG